MPIRSRPGRAAYGPSWPNALIRTTTSVGLRSAGPMCHCSSVPGRKFSTTTSAVAASRRNRSWPSSRRRSSVTLLRPRPSIGPLMTRCVSERRQASLRYASGLVAALLGADGVHAALLARLGGVEGGRRVAHELVDHEVVPPRLALALDVEHAVDRVLDRLRSHGRHLGDLVRHVARGRAEFGCRHDLVHEAESLGVRGLDRLGAEQELLGFAWPELPRLDEELDARARHAQDGVRELGVVGGDDEVAHAREHETCSRARALNGGDRRFAEVADLHAAVEVHDLLVPELAFRRVAHLRPRVALREELLEVVTGREVLALAGEDDDPDVVALAGAVEGGVELVQELRVLGVRDLGPVQRDRAHRPVDVVAAALET